MTTKPSWLYRQSGVIPFRTIDDELRVMLITSSGGKRWVIPKGVVERNLSPKESAVQEALEEAGITGRASEEPVGAYEYEKKSP